MKLSAFTPFGLLRYSGDVPLAQKIYNDMVDAEGAAFDLSEGTYEGARFIASAKAKAVAAMHVQKAANAVNPSNTYDLIPAWEERLGVVPGPTDTAQQRQATLAARALAPTGASMAAVIAALQTLLGTAFLAYLPTPLLTAIPCMYPTDPTTVGSYVSNQIKQKVFSTTGPVALLGMATSVRYVPNNSGDVIAVNDTVSVQSENWTQAESVNVVSASLSSFTAVFTKAHDVGCSLVIGRKPLWYSPKRYSLIVVTPAVAGDPNMRAKIHAVMRTHARSVSQWSIVQNNPASPSTSGPWSVGQPLGDLIPIGEVTL